jgi:rRNA maturation protein Rpf1
MPKPNRECGWCRYSRNQKVKHWDDCDRGWTSHLSVGCLKNRKPDEGKKCCEMFDTLWNSKRAKRISKRKRRMDERSNQWIGN